MTQDKAREFFSAFHEGTLEGGLRASLERDLRADAALRAEYDAFVGTVDSLDALRYETVEIPAYLGDRIALRLEPAREAKAIPFWKTLFAPRASAVSTSHYGWAMGLAGALLVAAVGLRGLKATDASTAGVVDAGTETVRWTQDGEAFLGRFAGSVARKVAVAPEGGVAQEYRLADRQPFELTLKNPNPGARRFKVSVGDDAFATVALPGVRAVVRKAGAGTVTELASALADAYRVPVVVKGVPARTPVRWSFESADARAAAEQGLDGHGNATMMDGNVLQIGE